MPKIFQKALDNDAPEVVKPQLARFLEYTFVAVDFVGEIMSSWEKKDWTTLERQAHSIKGRASLLFLDEFFLVAQKLQFSAKAKDLGGVQEHMMATLKYLQLIQEELHSILNITNTPVFQITPDMIKKISIDGERKITETSIDIKSNTQDKDVDFIEETEFIRWYATSDQNRELLDTFYKDYVKDKYAELKVAIENKDLLKLKREFVILKKKAEAVKMNNYFRMAKRMQALVLEDDLKQVATTFETQFKVVHEKTMGLIKSALKKSLLQQFLDTKQLGINYHLQDNHEAVVVVVHEFIHEMLDDFGLLDTLKYLIHHNRQCRLKKEIKYLQYIGNRIGLINVNQLCEQPLETLKHQGVPEKQLRQVMQVFLDRLGEKVKGLLNALQVTRPNLEVQFDLRYCLQADRQKGLLIGQSFLYQDKPTQSDQNIFNDPEYEDSQLEKVVEAYRGSLAKQEVQLVQLPPQDQDIDVLKEEHLLSAQEQLYFQEDYLTKGLCLLF